MKWIIVRLDHKTGEVTEQRQMGLFRDEHDANNELIILRKYNFIDEKNATYRAEKRDN